LPKPAHDRRRDDNQNDPGTVHCPRSLRSAVFRRRRSIPASKCQPAHSSSARNP
jgi:hypothetical protein